MARNDITNDLIANTKGSAEKYAQGWDRLFGKKVEQEYSWTLEDGTVVSFKGDPNGYGVWTSLARPTTVLALDFHDSQPVNNTHSEVQKSFPDDFTEVWTYSDGLVLTLNSGYTHEQRKMLDWAEKMNYNDA